MYDISNSAYVEADVMDEGRTHEKHQTFDIAEDGNIDRVTRILNLAFSEIRELLYPFTKVPVEDGKNGNDILVEPETYTLTLKVPERFSDTTYELLKNYIHEYLICRVLWDWFSTTKPESAAIWKGKADAAMDEIKSAKSTRIGKVRRGQSPF